MSESLFTKLRQLPRPLLICCVLTWIGYAALLLVFLLANVISDGGSVGLWAVQSIPLLLLLPLLIKHSYQAYSGLALLILVYFVVIVPEVMSPDAHWYKRIAFGLILFIFLFSMYSSRWLQRWQKGILR